VATATVRELINLIGFEVDSSQLKKSEDRVKKFKTGLKTVGLAVGASIIAIGTAAVKAAADMEMLTTQFEVMLGSAEAANSLMEELKTFSAATPFALNDLAKGTQNLLAFGVPLEDVMETMRMLGDAAGGNNEKLNGLVLAFGKVQTKGKVSMEEINMIAERGVPIIGTLVEQLGVTEQQFFKLVSAGKIGREEIKNAFKTMTSEGGIFFQGMQKQSQTFTGMLSTMKDNITLVLAEIGGELLPVMKIVLQSITNLFRGSLGTIIENVLNIVTPLLNNLVEILEMVLDILVPVIETLTNLLIPVLNSLMGTVIELFKPLLQLIDAVLTPLLKIIDMLTPIFVELINVISKVFSEELLKVFEDLIPVIEDLGAILTDTLKLWLPIMTPILKLMIRMQALWLRLKIIMQTALFRIAIRGLGVLLKFLRPIVNILTNYLLPAFEKLGEIMDFVFDKIDIVLDSLFDKIEGLFDFITKFLGGTIQNIFKFFILQINGILTLINQVIKVINKLPFAKNKLETIETLNANEILNKLSGITADKKVNNITVQNEVNVNNNVRGQTTGPQMTKNAIQQSTKTIFNIELKKLLVDAGL